MTSNVVVSYLALIMDLASSGKVFCYLLQSMIAFSRDFFGLI